MFRINYLAVIYSPKVNAFAGSGLDKLEMTNTMKKNKHNEKIFFSYIIEYQCNSICTE